MYICLFIFVTGDEPMLLAFELGRCATVAALRALAAALEESGYDKGLDVALRRPPPAMAPFAARRLFCLSKVDIKCGSVAALRPPLLAKAWLAAEFPQLLEELEDGLSGRLGLPAASVAAVLGPTVRSGGWRGPGISMSVARLAAL